MNIFKSKITFQVFNFSTTVILLGIIIIISIAYAAYSAVNWLLSLLFLTLFLFHIMLFIQLQIDFFVTILHNIPISNYAVYSHFWR